MRPLSSLLIDSVRLPANGELTPANILIENGKISKITKLRPGTSTDSTIDGRRLIALPGMIDAHVHLRDMELSYKETFETGTQAAAAGGFTTVLDMPNTRPPTISQIRLAEKMDRANGRLFSNVGFQGALVNDRAEVERMVSQGAIAFKLYLNKSLQTFDSSNQTELREAMRAAKECNALVTVHAEDGAAIKAVQEKKLAAGRTSVRDFLSAHEPKMEISAVKAVLGISRTLGTRVHICHITIPAAVKLVRHTRHATCEATAHHLLLKDTVFKKQRTMAICVPPIRNEKYRQDLWRLFSSSQVDILASDHAPHTLEEKTKDNAWEAASGVPGLETSLPVLFTQVAKGRLTLQRLIGATSKIPAKIFGLRGKGSLREGFDADIILVDPKAKVRIDPREFLSKAKFSPFAGMRCIGTAAYTIVNGTVVAEKGRIVGPPVGRVMKGNHACASS
jgi:dihydroorotase